MHQFDLSKIKIEEFCGENAIVLNLAHAQPILTPTLSPIPAEAPVIAITPMLTHKVKDESGLRTCPKCEKTTFKIENGCNSCINPECGYAKCDM